MRWIPLDEVIAECMKEPGFEEAFAKADQWLDEEIAIHGTIGNPKPQLRPALTRSATKRKSRGFSAKLKRVRATA